MTHVSWQRLRAEAEHIAIRIFDVKLERPIEIGERHSDGDAVCDQFIVQPGGVLDADPDPGAAASLAAAAQIDAGAVAVHGRKVLRAPTRVLKSQLVDVEGERGLHVLHAQDRLAVFEVGAGWGWVRHSGVRSLETASKDSRTGDVSVSPIR